MSFHFGHSQRMLYSSIADAHGWTMAMSGCHLVIIRWLFQALYHDKQAMVRIESADTQWLFRKKTHAQSVLVESDFRTEYYNPSYEDPVKICQTESIDYENHNICVDICFLVRCSG